MNIKILNIALFALIPQANPPPPHTLMTWIQLSPYYFKNMPLLLHNQWMCHLHCVWLLQSNLYVKQKTIHIKKTTAKTCHEKIPSANCWITERQKIIFPISWFPKGKIFPLVHILLLFKLLYSLHFCRIEWLSWKGRYDSFFV